MTGRPAASDGASQPAAASSFRSPAALTGLSDEEVVARVRGGETNLFELLMRRHNQRLFRLARSVVPDDDEAADVVQDAWVRAWQHLDQFAGRAAFSTWAGRIALRGAWDRQRERRRIRQLPALRLEDDEGETMDVADESHGPGAEADRHEVAELLSVAVDRLAPPLRLVFVLRDVEGVSTDETAALLDITRENVKVRLHRARAAVRRKLEAAMGSEAPHLYGFDGARCDAIVAAVMTRLRQADLERGP